MAGVGVAVFDGDALVSGGASPGGGGRGLPVRVDEGEGAGEGAGGADGIEGGGCAWSGR